MMPDVKKVIKGLEILMNGCEYIHCDDCCFYISTKPTRCGLREEQIQEDALTLLKEQEAVEPRYEDFFGNRIARCGNCNGYIVRYKYCPGCGRSVKW